MSSISDSNQSFALAYQSYEGNKLDERCPILVVHGMFGSTINWHGFCKSYSMLTGRKIIAVDCRNHGQGPRSDHMTYPLMAGDIAETLKILDISKVIVIGHSIGGKVAMELALSMPSVVEKLIVEDIPTIAAPEGILPLVLTSMLNVDFTKVKSKKEIGDLLAKAIPVERIRVYILTNLHENTEGKFYWLTDVRRVEDNLHELLKGVDLNERLPYQGEVLFIGGEDSQRLRDVDMNEARKMFPKAELRMIQGVGHFVHTDKPEEFQEIVHNFLTKFGIP